MLVLALITKSYLALLNLNLTFFLDLIKKKFFRNLLFIFELELGIYLFENQIYREHEFVFELKFLFIFIYKEKKRWRFSMMFARAEIVIGAFV